MATLTRDNVQIQLEQIDDLLRDEKPAQALPLALQFVERNAANVDGWIALVRVHLNLMQFVQALQAAEKAVGVDPQNPIARLLLMESLYRNGRNDEAEEGARALEDERKYDPAIGFKLGQFFSQTNRHGDAARCYERVCVLQPANRLAVHNLAGAYIGLGEIDKAEALFDRLLAKDPYEFPAYYNRATLRKQTADRNHVAEMEQLLSQILVGEDAEPILCYALAKELEDMGEWRRAFYYLKRGANARRRTLTYRVEYDETMLETVRREFGVEFLARDHEGYAAETPFFIIGLPRSGTTLVDRILSSHSKVGSVGESDEFSRALVRLTSASVTQGDPDISHVRDLDFGTVGREYCRGISGLLSGPPHLVDKTPRNFYYAGMILTALPNAKIIHLRRHPVDSCYAIYKTLFRTGCPFSYDLNDLARFYLAYRKTMDHWHSLFPGRILDVDYEELVNNQEAVSRRMIAHCGLEWEDACLSFEKNSSPSLTASAAQVRQPIYKTSVALWRHYEQELAPLIAILEKNGISLT